MNQKKQPPILLSQIRSHPFFISGSRHQKIRLQNWLSRLQSITSNNLWRKNRDNYLRLLYVMLQYGQIMDPFKTLPQNQIPKLHRHQINCCLVAIDRNYQLADNNTTITNNKQKQKKCTAKQLWQQLQNGKQCRKQNKQISQLELNKISRLSPIIKYISNHSRQLESDQTHNSLEYLQKILEAPPNPTNKNKTKNQQIKYFSKQKQKQNINNRKQSKINMKQFLQQIYTFLKKYQDILKDDKDYMDIFTTLSAQSAINNQLINQEPIRIQNSTLPMCKYDDLQEQGGNYFNKNNNNKNNNKYLLCSNYTDQYNYSKGQYSQYSDIQIAQGISPQKLIILNQQQQNIQQNQTTQQSHKTNHQKFIKVLSTKSDKKQQYKSNHTEQSNRMRFAIFDY